MNLADPTHDFSHRPGYRMCWCLQESSGDSPRVPVAQAWNATCQAPAGASRRSEQVSLEGRSFCLKYTEPRYLFLRRYHMERLYLTLYQLDSKITMIQVAKKTIELLSQRAGNFTCQLYTRVPQAHAVAVSHADTMRAPKPTPHELNTRPQNLMRSTNKLALEVLGGAWSMLETGAVEPSATVKDLSKRVRRMSSISRSRTDNTPWLSFRHVKRSRM